MSESADMSNASNNSNQSSSTSTVDGVIRLGELGIILSLLNALFTASGLTLQKIVKHQQYANPNTPSPLKNPKFIAGLSYVVIGLIIRPFIDMLLPLSTASILSALTVIFTYVLEYFFTAGPMDIKIVFSLCLILSGVIIATYSGNIVDEVYSVDDIRAIFMKASTIIASGIIIGLLVAARQVLAFSAGGIRTAMGLFYSAIASGVVASWYGAVVKATMELLKYTFLHGTSSLDMSNPWVWTIVVLVAVFFTIKMNFVDSCLAEYAPAQFLPLYQAAAIFFNVVYGLVMYQDMAKDHSAAIHSSENVLFFDLGLVMVVIGLILLAERFVDDQTEKAGFDERRHLLDVDDTGDNAELPLYSSRQVGNNSRTSTTRMGLRTPEKQSMIPFPVLDDQRSTQNSSLYTFRSNNAATISKILSAEAMEVSKKRGVPSAALL